MTNLEHTIRFLLRLSRKSRGSPVRRIALAISGVSIGILLASLLRRKKQRKAVERKPLPLNVLSLDDILDEIESNTSNREITDAINKTKIWGSIGDRAVMEDIMLARQVRQIALRAGLDVVITEGYGDDYDDEDEDENDDED